MTESATAIPLVLVVEDNAIIRMSLMAEVTDAGFAACGASSADQAIPILAARSDIRLVVTDIDMPGTMDGLRLAAYIRERWPPIQLIVVSGHITPRSDEMPPGSCFFSKPYSSWHIIGAMQAMLA